MFVEKLKLSRLLKFRENIKYCEIYKKLNILITFLDGWMDRSWMEVKVILRIAYSKNSKNITT
jgi:hypothetical protein